MTCVIWNLALVCQRRISFGARYVHGLCLMHQSLRNYFGSTCWYSQVQRLKWRLSSVCLEIVLIMMQDRCTICMEHTICSEINLDALDGTPILHVSYGISLRSVQRQCQFQSKIGARFAPNAPQDKKPFWTQPMVLLGQGAQVKAQIGLFGDSANLDARQMHGLHGTYDMVTNQSRRT